MSKKKETKNTPSMKRYDKKTTFKFMAPEAQSVLLAGLFNAWNLETHPLERTSNSLWEISINLSPGRYEYRFLVDGRWQNDPNCAAFASNPFGSENCIVTLE